MSLKLKILKDLKMKLDRLTARGALTIVVVIYLLAELLAGIIERLF